MKLPNYQEKQHILYIAKRPEKDLIAFGDRCLKEGRISDAIDFYHRANHILGLEKIKDMVEASGDALLFQNVMKAMNRLVSMEDWNRLGQRAFDMGKYSFAFYAFEKSENKVMLEKLGEILKSGVKENMYHEK